MMFGYGLGSGFGFFGAIMMLLFWGLIIWAIFSLVRGISGGGCCGMGHTDVQKGDRANDILRERYAKGEISKEEFENMKKNLQ